MTGTESGVPAPSPVGWPGLEFGRGGYGAAAWDVFVMSVR